MKITTNHKCWKGCREWNSITLPVGMQTSTTTLENNMETLKKLNIDLPYDSAIPILRIYPKECDLDYSIGICTPMLIAAVFPVAKVWKQSRFPTTAKWIKKMWYLYPHFTQT
jgi:hypothetical protein